MKLDIIFGCSLDNKARTAADVLIEFMELKGWSVRSFFFSGGVLLDDTFNTCDWTDADAELVLTVDSPYSVYAIKKAFVQIGKLCRVVSWVGAFAGVTGTIEENSGYLSLADAHFTSDEYMHKELRRLLPESHIFDVDLTFSRKADCTESDCAEKIFNTYTVGSDAIQSTYKTDGAGAKGISLEVGSSLWCRLAEFECKLRAIATEPDTIFQLKEYGRLYNNDKISVIIPCYNASKYIKTCILSLLASTLPLSMLEFIFVDDVSTDDTRQIIKQYEAAYPDNILLVECEKNGGPGTARNIGLQYASGDYIGFVDADDIVKPDMMQKLYEAAALYQCDCSECGICYVDEDCNPVSILSPLRAFYDMETYESKEQYIYAKPYSPAVVKMFFRKRFIDEYMIKFPGDKHAEDACFYNIAVFCAKRIFTVEEPLYMYRQRAGSLIHSDGFKQRYKDEYVIAEKVYETLKEKNLVERYEELAGYVYYYACVGIVEKMLTHIRGIETDTDMIRLVRKQLFCRFPNIRTNRYVWGLRNDLFEAIRDLLFTDDENFEHIMVELTVSEHEPQAK